MMYILGYLRKHFLQYALQFKSLGSVKFFLKKCHQAVAYLFAKKKPEYYFTK